jgi:predicted acylesterase/phospholipase RssA
VTAIASLTSGPSDHCRRKTALVLAGGGITGFLYEVGVPAALDELAGGAASRPNSYNALCQMYLVSG